MNELRGLFLDDIRSPRIHQVNNQRINWVIVRSYNEFVNHISKHNLPDIISFDHDLADSHTQHIIDQAGRPSHLMTIDYNKLEKTGYHCAKWLIEYCIDNDKPLPKILTVHSANPAGSDNILALLNNYAKVRSEVSKIYKTIW